MYHWNYVYPAPSGPPVLVGVTATINSLINITVSWSPPLGGANGYVILYSTDGASNMSGMTQLVEGENKIRSLLTGLKVGQTYVIRMFAYKDLPSILSDTIFARLTGEKCPKVYASNYYYVQLYDCFLNSYCSSSTSF